MNRKKAILAIFMMAFLIIIGFVFPSIWKSQKGNKKSETENTQHDNNENTETEQAENNESISFQDFEALEDFFSKEQVKLFQEELTSYLKNVKQMSLGMFVALDYVWDKAKENRTEEKAIFVDEVWQLIGASSNRLAAEFVLEIAKIIRAYSGAGIFATQDLNDFFALDDGKYGKGIINNCKTKIILNMEDEEAQRVKTILRLSETEVMNITHFQRGNGLISTNNNNITVEFKASNLEKELITTDRQELLEILKRQDKKVG